MEQYLNADGTAKICDYTMSAESPVKPCRFAFFIYNTPEQEGVLKTPYGDFPIDAVTAYAAAPCELHRIRG